MAEFLLEVLSEEIPARMQENAAEALAHELRAALVRERIKTGNARHHATPRRLTVVLEDLPRVQPDLQVERLGPRVGAPEKAVAGFARSAGLRVDELGQCATRKGDTWFARIHEPGRPVPDVLSDAVPAALGRVPWPKSMRWGSHDLRWVRPIVSMVAVFDGDPVSIRFGPVESGNETSGHRFLAPDPIRVACFRDYTQQLESAFVILDRQARCDLIAGQVNSHCERSGLFPDLSKGLLAELAGLVEWPVVMTGEFDPAFMSLPDEVLVTEMIHHQRYIPLRDKSGNLFPQFAFVANRPARNEANLIVRGNERVLSARLADGQFFWDQDRQSTLAGRVSRLSGMVFHNELGTVGEQAVRLRDLAGVLAKLIPDCDMIQARNAGLLAKADLTTGMVVEFPELQGTMGAHYARHDGEPEPVAGAIADQYKPRGPGDQCPREPVSVALALADKLDALTGFFAIGRKPTGSGDPLALRRACLGVIRLVIENSLRIDLDEILTSSLTCWQNHGRIEPKESVHAELRDFFVERLRVHLRGNDIAHDVIEAVIKDAEHVDLTMLTSQVGVLEEFLQSGEGSDLLAGYRRVSNILRIEETRDRKRYAAPGTQSTVDLQAFDDADRSLEQLARETGNHVDRAMRADEFRDALSALAMMRETIDTYFDHVTVNADDPVVRVRRLGILANLRSVFHRVADFSCLGGRPDPASPRTEQ